MLECVVFDLDDTLIHSTLDFNAIRAEIGDMTGPILEHMETVSDEEKARINAILERHEREAAEASTLSEGAMDLLNVITERGAKTAILTRNSRTTLATVMERHGIRVDATVAREDAPPKPSPEPVLVISRTLGVPPKHMLVVGDYIFDIESGRNAGARTALVRRPNRDFQIACDYEVRCLTELIPIVETLLDGRTLTSESEREKS